MSRGVLGKDYRDGEWIIRQGEVGDEMFVVQDGQVEVLRHEAGDEVRLARLGPGDFFGGFTKLADLEGEVNDGVRGERVRTREEHAAGRQVPRPAPRDGLPIVLHDNVEAGRDADIFAVARSPRAHVDIPLKS